MKRNTAIKIIAIAAIAILAIVHTCVTYGPAAIQALRRMHGM